MPVLILYLIHQVSDKRPVEKRRVDWKYREAQIRHSHLKKDEPQGELDLKQVLRYGVSEKLYRKVDLFDNTGQTENP